MYPIETLPEGLRKQSRHKRSILLAEDTAPEAVSSLAEQGWAIRSCEARTLSDRGEFRHGHYFERSLRSLVIPWEQGESWGEYVGRSAQLACQRIEILRDVYRQARPTEHKGLYFMIDAMPENIHLERIKQILETYFPAGHQLAITESTTVLPLVAAVVRKSTKSFSAGQRVYVYNAHWGMYEQAMVIGRYRRAHRWICGHCPIDILDNFRPKLVYDPQIIRKLREQPEPWLRNVPQGIFIAWRFFAVPQDFTGSPV